MKICYVDESGCTGVLPTAVSDIQPILAIVGFIIDAQQIYQLTDKLILLKKRFFPRLAPAHEPHMGWILYELKGADLRRDACDPVRNTRRHALTFLSAILDLAVELDAKLIGRVWVKGIAQPFNGVSVYTYSMQSICEYFQNYLEEMNDEGIVIVDSRLQHLNTTVAHSIFTQKFKATDDAYDRIIELPVFANSRNHAGLQIADIISSAIITPMALNAYCDGFVLSIHVRPGYVEIRRRFGPVCLGLQHRFIGGGRWHGGLTVSDGIGGRPGSYLFHP